MIRVSTFRAESLHQASCVMCLMSYFFEIVFIGETTRYLKPRYHCLTSHYSTTLFNTKGAQFHYLTNIWQRPQHGGAHFNVLIKNPAKAASPTLLSANERTVSEAEGARARCDWPVQSVAPEFHHQPDWSCQINRRGAFTGLARL